MSAASARDTGADAATQTDRGSERRGRSSLRPRPCCGPLARRRRPAPRRGAARVPARARGRALPRRGAPARGDGQAARLGPGGARRGRAGQSPCLPRTRREDTRHDGSLPTRMDPSHGHGTWSSTTTIAKSSLMNMALSLRVALDPSLHVPPAPPPTAPPAPPPADAAAATPARRAWPDVSGGLAGAAVFGTLRRRPPGRRSTSRSAIHPSPSA